MNVQRNATRYIRLMGLLLAAILTQSWCSAQEKILVNLAMLDGVELTLDNIFNYQIINNSGNNQEVQLKGTVRYRKSSLRFSYDATILLTPGNNQLTKDRLRPVWNFSQPALRELFFDYRKLPQGTYEYCVEIALKQVGGDLPDYTPMSDCIYQKVDDIFLINLVDPENDAKLTEYYPMFHWVVNYPFASQLSYRLRVAELKPGQSHENAITRNNPVYQDNRILATTAMYPVTATPLKTWQPYVWTVDAYYKGILLGGAEVWKFTIVEDSLLEIIPKQQAFYEFATHDGDTRLYAVGELKLKYVSEIAGEQLSLRLTDVDKKEINLPESTLALKAGDNRLIIPLKDKLTLAHKKKYNLYITTKDNRTYVVPFMYINPLYLN